MTTNEYASKLLDDVSVQSFEKRYLFHVLPEFLASLLLDLPHCVLVVILAQHRQSHASVGDSIIKPCFALESFEDLFAKHLAFFKHLCCRIDALYSPCPMCELLHHEILTLELALQVQNSVLQVLPSGHRILVKVKHSLIVFSLEDSL